MEQTLAEFIRPSIILEFADEVARPPTVKTPDCVLMLTLKIFQIISKCCNK